MLIAAAVALHASSMLSAMVTLIASRYFVMKAYVLTKNSRDTDADKMPEYWEAKYGFNKNDPADC